MPARSRLPVDYARGVHRLVPSLLAAVTDGAPSVVPLPDPLRAVAVVVIDGLGARQLARHEPLAPNLAAAPRHVLHAPFPTTTVTSLTSIGTGCAPGEHGLTGASFVPEGANEAFFGLSWNWQSQVRGQGLTIEVVPEDLQPCPTVFDAARLVGVRPVTVLRDEFVGSGLTRAGLRGAEVVTANGLTATLDAVRCTLLEDGPVLVYAHHGRLDLTGHLHGPGSNPWLAELARIDAALGSMASALPADAAVVVTADHGMVGVPESGLVELTDAPELLSGVAVVAGEPRARHLHTVQGARDDVLAVWRESAGEDAHVLGRDEAVEAGWFGTTVSERVRTRIGDVVVSARTASRGWVHRDLDPFGGRLAGHHGAATGEEVEVPAIALVP